MVLLNNDDTITYSQHGTISQESEQTPTSWSLIAWVSMM